MVTLEVPSSEQAATVSLSVPTCTVDGLSPGRLEKEIAVRPSREARLGPQFSPPAPPSS